MTKVEPFAVQLRHSARHILLPLPIFPLLCQLPRPVKFPALPSLAVLLLCFLARAGAGIQVSPPLWGFDGKVLHESFNVFSIEVTNPSGRPFDGELVLDDSAGLGSRSSAAYKQPVYLAPGSARWVQFHPYIGNYVPQWRLSWGGSERGSVDLDAPNAGPPAVALLADPASSASRSAKMRVFPESLFPVTVSATDGLHSVVLDHQPRWEPQRREAFLDWVNRGGIVHLIPGPDGALPQFTESLASLNVVGKRGRVGAGWVVKHDAPRTEITGQSLKDAGFSPPEIKEDGDGNIHDLDGFILRKLAAVTKPDIAWGLIYLLTAVYVILIGPVFYLLRKRDYRVLLGGFIATVALFAGIFTAVGRRGYGEKQIYHSLSIARSLGAGRFDVREWVHAFATTGDVYRFQHADGSQLYAALGDGESVRGEVAAGKDSRFTADIPLFSSRPFLHRGVVKTSDPAITVVAWEEAPGEKKGAALPDMLRIRTEAGFRQRAFAAIVSRHGRYSEMELIADGFEMKKGSVRSSSAEFFRQRQFDDDGNGWHGNESGTKGEIERRLRTLHPAFISRVNNESAYFRKHITSSRPEDDRVRVFIYAEAPPEFAMKNERFQAGTQFVLYVHDIFKP